MLREPLYTGRILWFVLFERYVGEGLSEGEMSECIEDVHSLIEDYEELHLRSKDEQQNLHSYSNN
jgi:hypothetical protein